MNIQKKELPPKEIPDPAKHSPEVIPQEDPEEPVLPAEPDIIPEEDPFETPPPYEVPPPGEGP